ncbi:aldo/keto reductase [Micromonospora sp. NPDC048898]|uniref:aldo/keto reductase n=1 Tax=Micromonospora sp. NPDC048898 TaxID=3364260 RepID=UPI00371F9B28
MRYRTLGGTGALLTQHLNLTPIVTLQPQYNLLARDIEFEPVPVCENEGIGILPWSPLGGGWLTGKYQRDSTPRTAGRVCASVPATCR